MPCCNRLALASNTGTRKSKLYSSGIQRKSVAQFPTLQKAGSRDKLDLFGVSFRSVVPKFIYLKPETAISGFSYS